MTTYPRRELTDDAQTLSDANLLNAVVIQHTFEHEGTLLTGLRLSLASQGIQFLEFMSGSNLTCPLKLFNLPLQQEAGLSNWFCLSVCLVKKFEV